MTRRHYTTSKPIDPLILRLLNHDRIREARMLPDGKLTDDHRSMVRADLDRLTLDEGGKRVVTFAKIARAIGKSGSVLSQWYSDTYAGDNDAITRLVNTWIDTTRQRDRVGVGSDYVPTWVAEQMMMRVRLAHHKGKMACIVSPPGSGKDMVIEAMAQEYDGFVVYCDKTLTPKQLLIRIANSCGIKSTSSMNTSQVMARIVDRLSGRQTVLFINEAQRLRDACADVIRALFDQTGVTIAMFGAANIFNLIDDRANGGGQFWRRCHKVNMLEQLRYAPNPEGAGARPLFTVAEVRAVSKSKDIRLCDDGVAEMLARIACLPGFGTMGLVCDLLDDVAYLFDEREATISKISQALIIGSDVEAEDILREVGRDINEYRQDMAVA